LPRKIDNLIEAIRVIQRFTRQLANNYTNLGGWAPDSVVDWLTEKRLNRMNSLANNLDLTLTSEISDSALIEGRLIIAWSHLGALAEMSLQVMLGLFYEDFKAEPNKPRYKGKELDLDEINFFKLLKFFEKINFWEEDDKKYWIDWLHNLRQYRNTIHAFQDRTLGTWQEVEEYTIILANMFENFYNRLPPTPRDYGF
jgi:hypothetical protein